MVREGSAVFVSDFHSMDYGLKKVKEHYMDEYDYVYILGDVTDRGVNNDGTGGLNLLVKIMNLTNNYGQKVTYIPGNHDEFLYECMTNLLNGVEDTQLLSCMVYNHGAQTINDIYSMFKNDRLLFNELYAWLENLPLQVRHYYNGVEYNAAHALFNEELYEKNPDFNLSDFVKLTKEQDIFNVLWFRKGEGGYNKKTLPKNNKSIMVVGHTPLTSRQKMDMTLENGAGKKIKVMCVDGGMTFDNIGGKMLKYITGTEKEESTPIYDHRYVEPSKKKGFKSVIFNFDSLVNKPKARQSEDYIKPVRTIEHSNEYYEQLWGDKSVKQSNDEISLVVPDEQPGVEPEELNLPDPAYGDTIYIEKQLTNNIIDYLSQKNNTIEILIAEVYEYYTKTKYSEIANAIKKVLEKQYSASGYKELRRYILDTAVKYIEMCVAKRYSIPEEGYVDVDYQVKGVSVDKCLNYITSFGNARTVAQNIGMNSDVFMKILREEGLTLDEYFDVIKTVNNNNLILSRIMNEFDNDN